MKQTATLVLLVLTMSLSVAQQEWAPIGAKWYINGYTTSNLPLGSYSVTERLGDEVVDGVTYRRVGDDLTLQQGHEVYFLYNDTLRLIYKFDVVPGDTVTFGFRGDNDPITHEPRVNHITYEVTSVDSVYIDTLALKRVTCTSIEEQQTASFQEPTYTYVERIGDIHRGPVVDCACLFVAKGLYPFLRCYEDNEILYKGPIYQFYGDHDCDYVQTSSTSGPQLTNLQLTPNPASNQVVIDGLETMADVTVRDSRGTVVVRQRYQPQEVIHTSGWTPGLYIIQVQSTDGWWVTKCIVR